MDIHIKGVQKVSLIDYPGKISSVVFLNKCNMRCPYCHNPELVFSNDSGGEFPDITVEEFMEFLDKKKKWIDGVCITGGEPTLHSGLLEFMKMIKDKGLLVKLDTNGTNPTIIEKAIEQKVVDFVSMDIKNILSKYEETANMHVNTENIKKSIKIIIEAGNKNIIDYEFRTTILPKYISEKEITGIGEMLIGAKKYFLQQFHKQDSLVDDSFKNEKTYTYLELNKFKEILQKYIKTVEIRY
ncbi:MAG: anaerobic ribonucleoside-triphosphate reductase activating protein [Candidatus Woesearchaeota archaeon]